MNKLFGQGMLFALLIATTIGSCATIEPNHGSNVVEHSFTKKEGDCQ